MEQSLQQIVVYTFYLIILTMISYGQRDPLAYYVTKHVEDTVVTPPVADDAPGFAMVDMLSAVYKCVTLQLVPENCNGCRYVFSLFL